MAVMPATLPIVPVAHLVHGLRISQRFLDKSLAGLAEVDSGFAPRPGMFTVAQQLAHIAQTVDWFTDGAFAPGGFSMDFATGDRSGAQGRLARRRQGVDGHRLRRPGQAHGVRSGEAGMAKPMAQGPVMGGQPRSAIVDAVADHNAHHRGSLVVYMRLLGKVPGNPYA